MGGSILGMSGLVGFDLLDCTVFGVSICARGVICSTVFIGGVSGPRMVFIFSAFKVEIWMFDAWAC